MAGLSFLRQRPKQEQQPGGAHTHTLETLTSLPLQSHKLNKTIKQKHIHSSDNNWRKKTLSSLAQFKRLLLSIYPPYPCSSQSLHYLSPYNPLSLSLPTHTPLSQTVLFFFSLSLPICMKNLHWDQHNITIILMYSPNINKLSLTPSSRQRTHQNKAQQQQQHNSRTNTHKKRKEKKKKNRVETPRKI